MERKDVRYFDQPTELPDKQGTFASIEVLLPVLELAPGITSRPLVGSNLLASFVRYEPGAVAPLHSHKEEQLFMVLEGEIELEMGGERRLMKPGDAALIPAWVLHGTVARSGRAYQLDVFSPPRQAMLELIRLSATR